MLTFNILLSLIQKYNQLSIARKANFTQQHGMKALIYHTLSLALWNESSY